MKHLVVILEIDDDNYVLGDDTINKIAHDIGIGECHFEAIECVQCEITRIHDWVKIKYAEWFKEGDAVHWRKVTAHRNLIHYTGLDEIDNNYLEKSTEI